MIPFLKNYAYYVCVYAYIHNRKNAFFFQLAFLYSEFFIRKCFIFLLRKINL